MPKIFLIVFLILVFFMVPVSAIAQDYNKNLQAITDLNRIQAAQNPKYERADKILTRRILDRKNRVVGEVQDVLFRGNGGLKSILVEFDRLRLAQPVYLNYQEMNVRAAGHAYQLDFDDKQVVSFYPQLLGNIETAAGEDSDEYSVKKTLGAPVSASGGRTLGTISDILFSADGDRVEAYDIRLSQGILMGHEVAVPVYSLNIINDPAGTRAMVSDEIATAMLDYAAGKR